MIALKGKILEYGVVCPFSYMLSQHTVLMLTEGETGKAVQGK
jgi:hypothetical protein